ncbi:MAG: EamA family transporter [Gammaproteobacteria bacterium]
MSWITLTLLSAFSFASADAATKRYFSDAAAAESLVVRVVLVGVLMLPWAMAVVELPGDWRFWAWTGLLVPLDLAAMVLYIRAITSAPLSHTLPYLAFTPVFTALTAWLILGEPLSPPGSGGVVLISAGAYLLGRSGGDGRGGLAPLRFILSERGPRLMLVVALLMSVTSTAGKAVLAYMPGFAFGPFYGVALGAATALVIGVTAPRGTLGVVGRRPLASALVAGCMALMLVTHFVAIERVEAAYMIALKRTSMLFGLGYGALMFSEPGLRRNLAAASVMLAGVALLMVLG